jgi:N-glycosylase/DNA lyase
LTKATYAAVGNHFRKLWGKEAGWAHSVLFTADLRAFSERLTAKVDVEVKQDDDAEIQTQVTSTIVTKRSVPDDIDDISEEKAIKKEEIVVQTAKTTTTTRRSKRLRKQ